MGGVKNGYTKKNLLLVLRGKRNEGGTSLKFKLNVNKFQIEDGKGNNLFTQFKNAERKCQERLEFYFIHNVENFVVSIHSFANFILVLTRWTD